MWQKLNRLDVVSLKKARIQIINVLQLVCAAPRCFNDKSSSKYPDWLLWDEKSSSLLSNKFGKNETISISLDVEKLILTINGENNQREHLVLSGMTYPMAYGWMSIKLGMFGLNSSLFSDTTEYTLEAYLNPDAEINSDDQLIYSKVVMYYGNAYHLFEKLTHLLATSGKVLIDPSNANMTFLPDSPNTPRFGFSPGNETFPEPYFFIGVPKAQVENIGDKEEFSGIWDSINSGFVIMASDFLTQNPDHEYQKVLEFFTKNYSIIVSG